MDTILLPVCECEVSLTLYGEKQWIQCWVKAIALNQKSALINWRDQRGDDRETEVPLGFIRYELGGRKRRGFQKAKANDDRVEAIAAAVNVKVELVERPEPADPMAVAEASGAGRDAANGWVETYYIKRKGKEYGPYRRHCWREGGKKRHKYLGGGF
jgi:hypothetical protein